MDDADIIDDLETVETKLRAEVKRRREAAGPELYEALRDILDCTEGIPKGEMDRGYAALRKANGR